MFAEMYRKKTGNQPTNWKFITFLKTGNGPANWKIYNFFWKPEINIKCALNKSKKRKPTNKLKILKFITRNGPKFAETDWKKQETNQQTENKPKICGNGS